jgi:hypothetical protein
MRIGLDPNGGFNPDAPAVVWGAPINPLSVWQPAGSVQVQAGGAGVVTVFLRSTPQYPLKHNDVYWDDVVVKLIEQGGAPAPALTASTSSGVHAQAAPPADPILDGLTASQQAPQAGGWGTLVTGGVVLGAMGLFYLFRRRK